MEPFTHPPLKDPRSDHACWRTVSEEEIRSLPEDERIYSEDVRFLAYRANPSEAEFVVVLVPPSMSTVFEWTHLATVLRSFPRSIAVYGIERQSVPSPANIQAYTTVAHQKALQAIARIVEARHPNACRIALGCSGGGHGVSATAIEDIADSTTTFYHRYIAVSAPITPQVPFAIRAMSELKRFSDPFQGTALEDTRKSVLKGIVFLGVPLLVWPSYSQQQVDRVRYWMKAVWLGLLDPDHLLAEARTLCNLSTSFEDKRRREFLEGISDVMDAGRLFAIFDRTDSLLLTGSWYELLQDFSHKDIKIRDIPGMGHNGITFAEGVLTNYLYELISSTTRNNRASDELSLSSRQ